jgi:hypothetical protein
VNRIQWGVHSVLAHLGARGNFHRIERELLLGEPPSTELGRIDLQFRTHVQKSERVFKLA